MLLLKGWLLLTGITHGRLFLIPDSFFPFLLRISASLQAILTRENQDRLATHLLQSSQDLVKLKSTLTWSIKYQECLDVPERFDQEFCVLGSEGFTTGWHCWEVSVHEQNKAPDVNPSSSRLPFVGGGKACWAVGVAKESIRRKGTFQLSSQEGIWAVGKSVRGEMVTFDMYHQKLSLQRPLQRLRVRLDCEVRNVEFLDAETEASLHISWVGSV
ncbi:hypothetical protein E2320_014211, partial [Naja naja]